MAGVWVLLHRTLYPLARLAAGRKPEPTLAITDGQSVKTTERGGVRGFDGHKRVKGRKRHILVDILGLPITNRVEPANMSDHRAGGRLLAGLASLWPTIRTVIADAGHESRKLARQLRRDGWVRWSRIVGQFGGVRKLGSRCHYAASRLSPRAT